MGAAVPEECTGWICKAELSSDREQRFRSIVDRDGEHGLVGERLAAN